MTWLKRPMSNLVGLWKKGPPRFVKAEGGPLSVPRFGGGEIRVPRQPLAAVTHITDSSFPQSASAVPALAPARISDGGFQSAVTELGMRLGYDRLFLSGSHATIWSKGRSALLPCR